MRSAYLSSVENAVHMKGVSPSRGHQEFQFFVALVRSLSCGPSKATCNAVHMNVDRKHLSAKCIHHYAFCNLFRNAREAYQKPLHFFSGLASKGPKIAVAETLLDGADRCPKLP